MHLEGVQLFPEKVNTKYYAIPQHQLAGFKKGYKTIYAILSHDEVYAVSYGAPLFRPSEFHLTMTSDL